MITAQEDRLVVEASDLRDLEAKLELGVQALVTRARELGDRGIRLTRLSPWEYVVELDPTIPFGVTLERCEWKAS